MGPPDDRRMQTVVRDKLIFNTFYQGPAALLSLYQRALRLFGQHPQDYFTEGTWQFYVDYALRDDTARHVCETDGLHTAVSQLSTPLTPTDRITAWVMTAIDCLHQYPRLLENEWRERIYSDHLRQISYNPHHAQMMRRWEKQRPYQIPARTALYEDYPTYRRRRFDAFLSVALSQLPEPTRRDWQTAVAEAEATDLPAYQRQLSILAYLQPDMYGETRVHFPLEDARVGLILNGRYYLLPACEYGSTKPTSYNQIRNWVGSILYAPADPTDSLTDLAAVRRHALPDLRRRLSPDLRELCQQMRFAPIWINMDVTQADQPLADIRQAERGIGDHPLTIFDTGKTAVFDLSHIFFDGIWGVALAEILTNSATLWTERLSLLKHTATTQKRPSHLPIQLTQLDRELIRKAPRARHEASAEASHLDLKKLQQVRQMLQARGEFLDLTVNDILILYRAVHAAAYKPSPMVIETLTQLQANPATRTAARLALDALNNIPDNNPAILIPVDGSRENPRNRVYPMTFEVPISHLDLVSMHEQTLAALTLLERTRRTRHMAFDRFDTLRQHYLTALGDTGRRLSYAKQLALRGESLSIHTIKLLAYLPIFFQRWLDNIPNQIDAINDVIKGREVFSNVGQVVHDSSLTRFLSAKDDNDNKALVWGVLTDADGVVQVTLRDFRPHVDALTAVQQKETAVLIARDQLDSFVDGFNDFVADLGRIMTITHTSFDEPFAARPTPEPSWSARIGSGLGWATSLLTLGMVIFGFWFLWSQTDIVTSQAELFPTETAVAAQLPVPTSTPTATSSLPPTAVPTQTVRPTRTPVPTQPPPPPQTAVPVQIQTLGEQIRERDQMPMIGIPGGTFQMGLPTNHPLAEPDEQPAHSVTLDPFWIDAYEVSVAQYADFLNTLGTYANTCLGYNCLITRSETQASNLLGIVDGAFVPIEETAVLPINQVSWYGAAAYCAWVGARLPTEAEWEYAARGPDGRLYPWGDTDPTTQSALFDTQFELLQPVNSLENGRSPFGLHHMAGNVWEWVADGYDTFYYVYSPEQNPTGPETSPLMPRVLRGGGYDSPPNQLRATNREFYRPSALDAVASVGFRCAADQSPQP